MSPEPSSIRTSLFVVALLAVLVTLIAFEPTPVRLAFNTSCTYKSADFLYP